jgi:hypothetical protein
MPEQEYATDPGGFHIEKDRPIVFEEGDFDNPHTELSITETAQDLGLPVEGYYNVPSIYGGTIYNPADPEHYNVIRQNVQKLHQSGFKFPNFPDIPTAEQAAQQRSEYLNQLRGDDLQKAREAQIQKVIMQMLQSRGGV